MRCDLGDKAGRVSRPGQDLPGRQLGVLTGQTIDPRCDRVRRRVPGATGIQARRPGDASRDLGRRPTSSLRPGRSSRTTIRSCSPLGDTTGHRALGVRHLDRDRLRPLGVLGARSYGRTTLTQGRSAFVTFSWGGSNIPVSQEEAFSALETTVDFWRNWLSSAKIPEHRWKPYIDRSALTFKALSYAPAGAIMAASTTSLPETPGGARNWDYRFTWIGDSAFMLRSLDRLGSTGRRSSMSASSSTRSAAVTSTGGSSCDQRPAARGQRPAGWGYPPLVARRQPFPHPCPLGHGLG